MRGWGDRRWWMLVLALACTCAAGWGFKAHCTPGGWTGAEQYATGCYSDAVPFWSAREVDRGSLPYLQARMEYPVLTGAAIWVEGGVARALFGHRANSQSFLGVVTATNALLALLVLVLLHRAGMDAPRLWGWALAPPLILYVGHNWDMLAVSLAVGAMLLARAGRLTGAATIAALGTAAKLYPVLLLPLLGLQALFARGARWPQRFARAAALSGAAIGAWALVNMPVALLAPANWSEFYLFSRERGGTPAATWDVLANLGLGFASGSARDLLAAALFVAGAAAIVALGWRRHRAQLWVLFTPVLAWFLLANKVYSPQFDLWLYPLLLMTAPRLWPVALFAAADIAAYFAEFWWLAGLEHASPAASPADIASAAIARGAVLLWLIADALRFDAPGWIRGAAGWSRPRGARDIQPSPPSPA